MSELKITGSQTPVVGKEEFYSVNQLLPSPLPFQNLNNSATNPFELPVEWSVHVLENAKWVQKEENDKTGNKVSYKFTQKSLERKGIRILAKKGNQVARLNIKPHKAESPKIDSIEFLDKNGNKPTKPFAYGQTLKARVHCLHMENRKVYATLWEDDAEGSGHDKANEKNKMKTLPGIVKGGIADIDFVLEPDFAKIANAIKAKGDADEGKTHEYYVTAEILNKKTSSKNTNVANPSYKDTTTTKPAAPKKETPAQKKGPSKKQEKEKEKEKSIGDGIIDWWEGLFKVKPIVAPNPEAPTGNNPLKTGEPDKNPKEDQKEGTSCGEKFCIKKDDKSELIREINIRLAGFGGNVPTDVFTDRTEKMIKQFQRDYMKVPETGKVCGDVLKAIDDFQTKYTIHFDDIKCDCKKCTGFGDGSNKNKYKDVGKGEVNHRYEYPGIHRNLIWALKTVMFYTSVKEKDLGYTVKSISSGYRCRYNNLQHNRTSTNHMGKALDIHFNKNVKRTQKIKDMEELRDKIFHKYLGAKWDWKNGQTNIFNLESTEKGAKTWVHYDVREYDPIYLLDNYFAKDLEVANGKSIVQLAKDLGFGNTCNCIKTKSEIVIGATTDKSKKNNFTIEDAEKALKVIKDKYGLEMAKTVEMMYRWECDHFKSGQYVNCGAPGMEVSGDSSAPTYGWDGSLYKTYPEYTPIGLWSKFENKGKSGLGGNDQVTDKPKKYIMFPSVEAGMMYVAGFITRHNNNVGRWHSLDTATQKNYIEDINTTIPRISNKL